MLCCWETIPAIYSATARQFTHNPSHRRRHQIPFSIDGPHH
ncbi:hypothetical protein HMPREF9579_01273 [Cutibacterium acnes HL087PA1]|nr:hypothetical protein HMPREF9576_02206 [Cutibacterium acnes HL110PA2]EFT55550.1 hypothetical protein HMPREF9610_01483 [Cutibacterium acnes HL027PA2]EGF04449.1 hypothetical protein HMPREF9586_00370 [Cutibacterium acnes HL083PA2]EGF68862.1 hypothetical protein HMPREF9579_01273 [Cutibacterium acnes HL087PA1]